MDIRLGQFVNCLQSFKVYSKAAPQATFVDIEKKMREEDFKIYLIAMVSILASLLLVSQNNELLITRSGVTQQEKPIGDCMSLINLQGKLNCKYVVGFYFSHKPQRATLRERWPSSVEENLARLEDAGLPYDRQIPKCANCGGKQANSQPIPGPKHPDGRSM